MSRHLVPSRPVEMLLCCLLVAVVCLSEGAAQRPGTTGTATLFEGARLIAGDGRAPLENSAFLVENRGTEVDRAAMRAAWTGR